MNDTKHVSIMTRLLKIVFSLYLIVAITLTCVYILIEFRDTQDQVKTELKGILKTLERGLTLSLWELDEKQFEYIVSGALLVPTITGITVYDMEDRLLAGLGDYPESNQSSMDTYISHSDILIYSEPEVIKDTPVAKVTFYSTGRIVFNRVKLGIFLVVVNAVIKTIALWLIFTYVGRRILQEPLLKLTQATQVTEIDALVNTRVDMGKRPNDEIHRLATSFNHMLNHLSKAIEERDNAQTQIRTTNLNLKETVIQRTSELRYALKQEEKLNDELKQQTVLLNEANKKLYQLAITDELTGIYNRRHFMEQSAEEVKRSNRYKHPLSIMMIDVDYFKRINDNYGHAAGDQVLKGLTTICQSNMRSHDILGRMGGEEFAITLPETGLEEAEHLAERLRSEVEDTPISVDGQDIHLTISIGLAKLNTDDLSIDLPLSHADQALYYSKDNGRNRVTNYESINL